METVTVEETISEIASEHDVDADALWAYVENMGITDMVNTDWDETISNFQDAYMGYYGSHTDFGWEIMEESCADIPDWVVSHIDWDSVWHCELRHDFFEENGYYFRNI